jgi:hypothetical protein
MNVFIGVATTLEYSVKGLVSMPIKWAYAGTEPSMIKVLVKDPQNEIERVDKVTVSEVYVHSPFKLVEMPRYKEFIRVMQKLEDTAIDIMEIAGQKEIQCKVRYQSGNEKTFPQVTGCKKEYEWHLPTKPEYTYAALTVEVPKLKEILRELKKHNVEILYLHDF